MTKKSSWENHSEYHPVSKEKNKFDNADKYQGTHNNYLNI